MIVRTGELVAAYHRGNAARLSILSQRRASLIEMIERVAIREGLSEKETEKLLQDALESFDEQNA